jgi:DNA processing protein
MKNDLLYQLALTQVPNIGCVHAKLLTELFGNAEAIFKAKKSLLGKIEGIGEVRAASIKSFNAFAEQEEEIAFIEKYKITPLFLTDDHYPKRLLHCYDPPTLVFYRGTADLNTSKTVAIIGTRNNTEYGRKMVEKILDDLLLYNPLVVSGLAYGVDAVAHKYAVKQSLLTVGVLAHGLDKIYPVQHTALAKEMITAGGGLLTEFRKNTKPDRHHFPTRNRIVAGMCDATIVIETGMKGGSMITANLANSYNRDVFAIPGKTTDSKSEGCNYLIQTNKAILVSSGKDIAEHLNWHDKKAEPKKQRVLFAELDNDEKTLIEILQQKNQVHIDELNMQCNFSSSTIASLLLNLELKGMIKSLPGKTYTLL